MFGFLFNSGYNLVFDVSSDGGATMENWFWPQLSQWQLLTRAIGDYTMNIAKLYTLGSSGLKINKVDSAEVCL